MLIKLAILVENLISLKYTPDQGWFIYNTKKWVNWSQTSRNQSELDFLREAIIEFKLGLIVNLTSLEKYV